MIKKNKIDFKLLNIGLIVMIIFFIYQTKDFWLGILDVFSKIFLPLFIAFIIAYALYPLVRKLTNKNIPKLVAVGLVLFGLLAITLTMIALSTPLIVDQFSSLLNGIVTFLKEISRDFNINFKDVQDNLSVSFNNILEKLGTFISNGAINFISVSMDYFSKFFIIMTVFVYLLIDMDRIRAFVKEYLKKRSKKMFNYVKMLDNEMEKYLSGFIKIVFISFFEYSIIYSIIGHPNSILLGALASFGNLIPYFGGIITNTIAAITAFVISPELFFKTCIVFIIFSGIDGNIINPFVYGKTNQIHPLVVIISVFAGGVLFGILGVVISLPLSILIIASFKYFKPDLIEIKNKHIKK